MRGFGGMIPGGFSGLGGRRAIMRLLEDSMAEKMLAREIKEGDSVIVDVDSEGKVTVLNGGSGTPTTSLEEQEDSLPVA